MILNPVCLASHQSVPPLPSPLPCAGEVRCQEGAVNGEVIIELAGGKTVSAIVTNDSIKTLGLKVGVKACALIKASHVILADNA